MALSRRLHPHCRLFFFSSFSARTGHPAQDLSQMRLPPSPSSQPSPPDSPPPPPLAGPDISSLGRGKYDHSCLRHRHPTSQCRVRGCLGRCCYGCCLWFQGGCQMSSPRCAPLRQGWTRRCGRGGGHRVPPAVCGRVVGQFDIGKRKKYIIYIYKELYIYMFIYTALVGYYVPTV